MRVATVQMGLVSSTLPQPAMNATSSEGPMPMSCVPRAASADPALPQPPERDVGRSVPLAGWNGSANAGQSGCLQHKTHVPAAMHSGRRTK